jgi:hypothetical protein
MLPVVRYFQKTSIETSVSTILEYPEVANWLQCQGPVRSGYTDAKYVDWMRDQLASCQQDSCSEETRNTNTFIPQRLLVVTAG